jgi:hypothetical protein
VHEFVTVYREEIITRCRAKVATRSAPPPTKAEVDHGVRRGSCRRRHTARSAAHHLPCLKWIDKLQQLAEASTGWRSQKEKDHVYGQFDEARAIYRKFLHEATSND